jgi:hypothetical protein
VCKIIHFEKRGCRSIAENNNLESIQKEERGYLERKEGFRSKGTCEDIDRHIGIQL